MPVPVCECRCDHVATRLRFEKHVLQTRQRAYNHAYRLLGNAADAEDVTQDAYVRAWQHIDSFDLTRGFEPWLFRIITNRAIDLLRRRKRVLLCSLDPTTPEEADGRPFFYQFACSTGNPEQITLAQIQEEYVEMAFRALSLQYKQVLLLMIHEPLLSGEIV